MDLQTQFDQAQEKRDNGQIDEAIADFQRIREAAVFQNEDWLAALCLHMIGVAYYQKDEYERAEDAYGEAIEAFKIAGEDTFVPVVQRDFALIAYKKKDYTNAENSLKESMQKLHGSKYKGQFGMTEDTLGVVYAAQGNYDKAIRTIENAITTLETTDDLFFLSTAYFDLANTYKMAGKLDEARTKAEKALYVLNTFSKERQYMERRKSIAEFLREV